MPKRSRLFSVGRNKASPARTASYRRASIRRSVIRSDAAQIDLDFECAGEPGQQTDASKRLEIMSEKDGPSAPRRDSSEQSSCEAVPTDMKDAPLPALPDDVAPPRRSATLPPPSSGYRHLQASTTSRMPQTRPQRGPQASATMPLPPQPQPRQQNIFRRLTNKFRSSNAPRQPPAPRPSRDNTAARDAPQRKSMILRMPPMPKSPIPAPPPNDFTSHEQRQAALRARGLIPATSAVPRQFRDGDGYMLPLSEQEAVMDRRFTVVVPGDSSTEDEDDASEAKRIRQAWLSKQFEASSPSLSEVDKDEDDDRVKAMAAPEAEPLPSRKSDAAERASKDGTIGERSPVRATFVSIDAPSLSPSAAEFGASARVASPFEGTEDFHTAPNSPTFLPEDRQRLSIEQDGHLRAPSPSSPAHPKRLPLTLTTSGVDDALPLSPTKEQHPSPSGSPSAHSAEKVSRWLRDSSEMPTPVPLSETAAIITASDHEPVLSASPRESLEAPLSPSSKSETVRSRREKPPPIVITQPGKAPSRAATAPSDSETSTASSDAQHSRPSLSGSGSPTAARRLAHAPSIRSRMTTVPALSPTRTVSSLGAESSLPTPTTTSCGAPPLARDASMSTSNSSDNGHNDSVTRPRRGTGPGLLCTASKVPGTGASAAIPEEFSETEQSSEGGEFGMNVAPRPPIPTTTRPRASQDGVALRRPVRAQTLGQATEKAQNRKSFSLFGKKSLEMPREARTSSSMMNLRRAFTSSKPRPQTTLEVTPEVGRKRFKKFDASHLPPSPTVPTPPTSLAPSSFRGPGRTSNSGLRPPPRQAVSPTMHSHGTIVHQTNFIEDDESRRLSEMAFLT